MSCRSCGNDLAKVANRMEDGWKSMLTPTRNKMWITSGLIGAGILTGGILLAVFTKNRGFIALGVLGGAGGFGISVGTFCYKYGASDFLGDALEEPREAVNSIGDWITGRSTSRYTVARAHEYPNEHSDSKKSSFKLKKLCCCLPCFGKKSKREEEAPSTPASRHPQTDAWREKMREKHGIGAEKKSDS